MFRPALFASRRQSAFAQRLRNLRWSSTTPPQSRISIVEARLPKFLRRYTTPLRTAPLSHISAFLILHEITAIVPIFGFGGFFYYTDWLPSYLSQGKWAAEGTEWIGRYLRKKGWIRDEAEGSGTGKVLENGEVGLKVVTCAATAWAVTKALMPLRIVFCVWATPWFAGVIMSPVKRGFVGIYGWKASAGKGGSGGIVVGKGLSPAAGTNAVGGRALPKAGQMVVK